MWRRYIFKVAPTRKAVARTFAEESENKPKTSKTDATEENTPNELMTMGLAECVKLSFAYRDMRNSIDKERQRLNREEHIILFGKQGYGNVLMHKILLGSGNIESCQTSNTSNNHVSTGEQTNKTKSNTSSYEFGEVKCYHDKHRRKVKITSLNVEDKASLSSLAISEEYSVVFCFPVSFRFTSEDSKLLETYLQYRQREDFKRVAVAFTFSDRKNVTDEDYIKNLPQNMKDFLNQYGNNYVFISSGDNSCTENKQSVIRLVKPYPSEEVLKSVVELFAAFMGVSFLKVFKIPFL